MTKHQLALKVSRKIYKGRGLKERFNAYQCIQSYFAQHSVEDLLIIAKQYDIKINDLI